MDKGNGKIIDVFVRFQEGNVTILSWASDLGFFGELTIIYKGDGHYDFDSEFVSLETIASVLKFWIENKDKENEKGKGSIGSNPEDQVVH